MPQHIIDILEMIQVNETNARFPVQALCAAKHHADTIFQQGAIRQACQGVMKCHVRDLALLQIGLGNIPQHAADPRRRDHDKPAIEPVVLPNQRRGS